MVNVFITIDTELWPFAEDWPVTPLDRRSLDLSREVQNYFYGVTASGEFGVRYQLHTFSKMDLKATFFVEALSAGVIGGDHVRSLVRTIQDASQEVQLQVMGSYLSTHNPEVARVQSSIGELRKQLQIMESGKGGKERLPGDRLRPAITSVPTLALEYGRLTRDLKVQETLYALLISQYEQAKLAEARDTPTVQVLDSAIPAEKKSRPKTTVNLLMAGMLSLFIGIFWAFIHESLDRRKTRFPKQSTQ